MQITGTTIPVSCNQANQNSFVNTVTNQAPLIPRNGTVQWPCAVFLGNPTPTTDPVTQAVSNAYFVTDLSNIVSANMVMRQGSATGTVVFEQVIPASAFNGALTYAQWQAQSAAHFVFSMDTTDTNQPEGTYFLAIGLTAGNGVDIPLTFCSQVQVKDYGIFNAAAPTAPNYMAWSKAESDARYATAAQAIGIVNLLNNGSLLTASLSCDFSQPRNLMFTAAL